MPSNKSVPDDDPELQDILMGGGLKEATLKDRKRMLGQFKEFVLKETAGINLEELALNKEGLESLGYSLGRPRFASSKPFHSSVFPLRGAPARVSLLIQLPAWSAT